MAYFSLHAYDADVWIRSFRGLNQADTGMNPDINYAAEAENVETPNGVLQPQAACKEYIGEFESRIETLASFHRRWYEGEGNKTWYVCCAGGKFYQKQAGNEIDWQEIELPEDVTNHFQSSTWSWVTYEINPQNTDDTVDVLLMSNGLDGMIMIVPPDRPYTWGDAKQHTWGYFLDMTWLDMTSEHWAILHVDTRANPNEGTIADGPKFGVIERYAERVWAGDITGYPDKLMYSAVYDPTDWTLNSVTPEDGAGEINQPSWDGDKFYALRKFGDQLVAFKKNRVWRVQGVAPGEYVFNEQYGGGTQFFNTIAVDVERVFMESDMGLSVYDGMSVSPYAREQVERIWRTVNKAAMDQMCAALYHDRYYAAFPVGDSTANNAMLVYNLTEGTILYYSDFHVESFLPADEELFITSSTLPGKILELKYDSWVEGAARGAATKWVSPWMDFGYKRIQKGGFDLYFVPEVQSEAVTLKITIQTEKKPKTKTYTIQPLTEEQKSAGREHRGKRLHFGGAGRKFRIIIETEEGVTAPWRLIGGLQLVVETDPD